MMKSSKWLEARSCSESAQVLQWQFRFPANESETISDELTLASARRLAKNKMRRRAAVSSAASW
jgi:hypothetical protein